MSRLILATAAAVILSAAVPMAAHAQMEQVGARVSTLGVGVEAGFKLSDHFSVRGVAQGYDWDHDDTVDDIRYDGKVKLGSAGLLLDYHPAANGNFYVTGGLYGNSNKVHETATPTQNTRIGAATYTPAEIGTLRANGRWERSAPYLGLGWDFPVGPVAVNLEAGAYFQGDAHVTLTSDGTLASNPAYQAELEKERQSLEDDLDDGGTWPVVSLGVRYKF